MKGQIVNISDFAHRTFSVARTYLYCVAGKQPHATHKTQFIPVQPYLQNQGFGSFGPHARVSVHNTILLLTDN